MQALVWTAVDCGRRIPSVETDDGHPRVRAPQFPEGQEESKMANIKDLKDLASNLNEKSNQLNKDLEAIQRQINELNIGLEVWLDDNALYQWDFQEEKCAGIMRILLGYYPVGDDWVLAVKTERESKGEDGGPIFEDIQSSRKPLLKASRQVRLAAVDRIPGLIALLKEEAEKALDRISKAEKMARSIA